MKHVLMSRELLLPGEDGTDLSQPAETLRAQLAPAGALESLFVHVQRSLARGTQAERAPLRAIRVLVDGVLHERSRPFDTLYSYTGRLLIAPEQLLRALRLQGLYTIRRERLLMAEFDYNLLFRWFVGLNMDDVVWDPTGFCKNRERLLAGEVEQTSFDQGWRRPMSASCGRTTTSPWMGP